MRAEVPEISSLDLSVARVVQAAKLMERALHDSGPWFIDCGPFEVVADRIIADGGVAFRATFPEHCWIGPPPTTISLRCRGRLCSIRPIAHPGDTTFTVEWRLGVVVPAQV